jgi:ribonuclease E
MKKEMLINVLQPEECRIAIVEDGVLEELYVERTSHESYVGNIYKGRIVNIEPSIQAAFVDFGVGRNGFLHVSDVEPAYYRHLEGEGSYGDARHGRGRDRHRGGPPPRPRDNRPPDVEDLPGMDVAELPERGEDADQSRPPERQGRDESGPQRGRRRRGGRGRRRDEDRRPPVESPPAEGFAPQEGEEPSMEPTLSFDEAAPPAQEQSPPPVQEEAPPSQQVDEEPRPRLMESAEHRTEEGDSSRSSSFSDDDLFFSRTPPPEPPAAPVDPMPVEDYSVSESSFEQRVEPVQEAALGAEPAAEALDEPMPGFSTDVGDDREPEPFRGEEDEEDFSPRRREPRREGGHDRGERRGGRDRGERRGGRDRDRDRRGGRSGGHRGPGRPGMGRPKPLIQDIFRRGQEVLVQVIKEGIGTKGPTLSTYISIAGRYLVLMPGLNRIGVSRKIDDDEQRRRLRDILTELQPPRGLGFIIRTAGMDRNKKELQNDLAYLSRLWQVVARRIKKIKAPAEIYQESDMITRTIRDTFTNEIDSILVDEPTAFEHAQEFLQIVMPRYANRIKLYDELEPMFHKYGIENEIARIQQKHVPLQHGGSIVIEQTEALVAIDVNSGNFRADNNAEETAFRMNLQAAKEIARQLRLRDLGGVIVNDFIDMREDKHRRAVEKAMRDAIKRDRARTKILRISQFGLIEMTRQRIRPSLKRSVYQDCPHCLGAGQVKTCESMSIEVMRMVQLAAHHEQVARVHVVVAEDVATYLLNKKRREISKFEEGGKIQLTVIGKNGAAPETMEFTCYDNNNNEVKLLPSDDDRPRRR